MSDKPCPQCGSWNRESALECACGYNFTTGTILPDTNLINPDKASKPKRRIGCGCLIALLVIILGYFVAGHFIDQNNYKNGHLAYLESDCETAIKYFDKVINSWNLIDLANHSSLAQAEMNECRPFLDAYTKEKVGNTKQALIAYSDFIRMYEGSILSKTAVSRSAAIFQQVEHATIADTSTCKRIDVFLEQGFFPDRDMYLPSFYFACGQYFDNVNLAQDSFEFYTALLIEYSTHQLAKDAEKFLFINPVACSNINSLSANEIIAQRDDFIPTLYYRCGRTYQDKGNWANAIVLFEIFLDEYPGHSLTENVEAALANAILARAKDVGAGEIAPPVPSGTTGNELTEVIIQNDSPEKMRIVFSGPEVRIEKLESCEICPTYQSGNEPEYCPEEGPIGYYTLIPGQYDVVVESISENTITPWKGIWNLESGDEYASCFYIITTTQP